MPSLVTPKVYLVGFPTIHMPGLESYLHETNQSDFLEDVKNARNLRISDGEILCSLYAKLCYKSLVVGKNVNVRRVREIQQNLEGCYDTGHGSVFEHANINFIVTNCSRVYTHEQVRHRVGVAYSQTSGRYCRLENLELVLDPILEPVKDLFLKCAEKIEDTVYLAECKLGLRMPNPLSPTIDPNYYKDPYLSVENSKLYKWVPDDSFDFEKRKKITSAIRRIAPNGQANEIGMTLNIRSIRQIVQTRTAAAAEWEIRSIYAQVYSLLFGKFPTLFYKSRIRYVDDLPVISGMKCLPFELMPADKAGLDFFSTDVLQKELTHRSGVDTP